MTRKELQRIVEELGDAALSMVKEPPIPVLTGNMRDNAVKRIPNTKGGWDIIIDESIAPYAKFTMMEARNPRNFGWTKYSQLKFEILVKSKFGNGKVRKRGNLNE
jgi:hypothetical protein